MLNAGEAWVSLPTQHRFLDDPDKLKSTEFRYGPIKRRAVIYRGPSMTLENGIEYLNVEEYLRNISDLT